MRKANNEKFRQFTVREKNNDNLRNDEYFGSNLKPDKPVQDWQKNENVNIQESSDVTDIKFHDTVRPYKFFENGKFVFIGTSGSG